jgi:U3 small nucleolar ribonucleoprotein protein IMP4
MSILLITTSHKPSPRTRSFVKDLASILPDAIVVTRGKKTLSELAIESHRNRAKYFMVIGEKRGNPSLIRIYTINYTGRIPIHQHIASIVLRGVTLSRENPESIKTYGIEYVGLDNDKCVSDRCFKLFDVLYQLLMDRISRNPDIVIVLEDRGPYTIVKAVNKLGKITGPIIRVHRVKTIGQ